MVSNNATEEFRAARDFLLRHRTEYRTAYEGFSWPRPEHFNWALDWFDTIARDNARTALHIVEEDGTETKVSFAEMAVRSDRGANWLRAQGVRAGDRILVVLGNQQELWETALAAMKLRAVVIPATPLLGAADLRDRVDRGGARHVLVRTEDTPSSPRWRAITPGSRSARAPRTAGCRTGTPPPHRPASSPTEPPVRTIR